MPKATLIAALTFAAYVTASEAAFPLVEVHPPLGFNSQGCPLATVTLQKANKVNDELLDIICKKASATDCQGLKNAVKQYASIYVAENSQLVAEAVEELATDSAKRLEECFILASEKHKSDDLEYTAGKVVSFCSKELKDDAYYLARSAGMAHNLAEQTAIELTDEELIQAIANEIQMRKLFPAAIGKYHRSIGYWQ